MLILAPISIGELYDKITILEIKAVKIQSAEKRENVRRELEELRKLLEAVPHVEGLADAVNELRDVNSLLWDIEDGKRAHEAAQNFDEAFVQLARKVYLFNDNRARIKRRINVMTGSVLIEEKEHNTKLL